MIRAGSLDGAGFGRVEVLQFKLRFSLNLN